MAKHIGKVMDNCFVRSCCGAGFEGFVEVEQLEWCPLLWLAFARRSRCCDSISLWWLCRFTWRRRRTCCSWLCCVCASCFFVCCFCCLCRVGCSCAQCHLLVWLLSVSKSQKAEYTRAHTDRKVPAQISTQRYTNIHTDTQIYIDTGTTAMQEGANIRQQRFCSVP